MNPVELNTLITYMSNHLYTNLDEKEFFNLGVFLSLLSKEMLTMEAVRDLCKWEKEHKHKHHNKNNDHKK